MLDERTEAILLEAMSTLSGGETVAVTRLPLTTILAAGDLTVTVADEPWVGAVLASQPSGDLARDDALLAVQVFDAYLTIASHIQEMPGAVAMNDETRRRIKTVREKLRGMI